MFLFLFLFFSMPTICSFFRLTELFQVKNGLTTKLRFFWLKMLEVCVGRTTLNGEKKKRMALSKLAQFSDTFCIHITFEKYRRS